MVDGVLAGKQDLGDGHEGVAVLNEGLQNRGQGLRGVQGGIVEQHDRPRLYLFRDPLDNLRSFQVFPVQAVTFRNQFKALGALGIRLEVNSLPSLCPNIPAPLFSGNQGQRFPLLQRLRNLFY